MESVSQVIQGVEPHYNRLNEFIQQHSREGTATLVDGKCPDDTITDGLSVDVRLIDNKIVQYIASSYKDKLLDGKTVVFDSKGRVTEIHNYVKGKYHGQQYSFVYRNGIRLVDHIVEYCHGKRVKSMKYYTNMVGEEQVLEKYLKYRNGIIYLAMEFHPNGKLSKKLNYREGELHGECIKIDLSGKTVTSYYKKGLLDIEKTMHGNTDCVIM
jgi:antitoxin component YwqK of YwqJK toxin-antitoxin module